MTTRLKVTCYETTKTKHWDATKGFIGGVKLSPVVTGSDENNAFFEATPSGQIQFGTINEAVLAEFEPGKSYYVDISPAE